MRKIVLVVVLLFSVITFGQKKHSGVISSALVENDSTVVKENWSKYVSIGVSISNGNSYSDNTNVITFQESSYPSLEFGFSRKNISLSGVIGRGNFKGIGSKADTLGNYFWEAKVTPSFPLGVVNVNIIFGAGTYFNSEVGNGFIEYGSGIGYTQGRLTYGISYTNWDGIDYITPNISFSL